MLNYVRNAFAAVGIVALTYFFITNMIPPVFLLVSVAMVTSAIFYIDQRFFGETYLEVNDGNKLEIDDK